MAEEPLKKRSDIHLARKLWHFCGVIAIAVVYHSVARSTSIQLFTLFATIAIITDLLRQQIPPMNEALIKIFHPFMRESERNGLAGTTHLLLGVFFLLLLFPHHIVSLTLFFLAIADPLAGYAGVLYGRDKIIGSKSLQGSFAAFLACTAIALVFYFTRNLMTERLLIVSLLSGLIGTFSELIPVGKLDDNLTFPIICATLLYGLFYLFGGF